MQIQYRFRAIYKEFHEPWQRALGNAVEHALKPLLDKHTKDPLNKSAPIGDTVDH